MKKLYKNVCKYVITSLTKFYLSNFILTSIEEYEEQFIISRLDKEFLEHDMAENWGNPTYKLITGNI